VAAVDHRPLDCTPALRLNSQELTIVEADNEEEELIEVVLCYATSYLPSLNKFVSEES
jgi:hypothetical protein